MTVFCFNRIGFLLFLMIAASNTISLNAQPGWEILVPIDSATNVTNLHFFNENEGWIQSRTWIENKGKCLLHGYTQNGGISWDTLIFNTHRPHDWDFYDTQNAVYCKNFEIWRTDSAWINNIKVYRNNDRFPNNIRYGSKNIIYAGGSMGVILISKDAGTTWTDITPSNFGRQYLADICTLDSSKAFFLYERQILFTNDMGQSWNDIPIPGEDYLDLNKIEFLNENYGWLGAEYNSIYHTKDGGKTWELQFTDNLVPIVGLSAYDSLTVLAGSADGGIYWTTDGGKYWEVQRKADEQLWFLNVQLISPKVAYIVGKNGLIMKTTTGGVTDINEDDSAKISKFVLHQNYPNPFNPVTTIKYSIPSKVKRERSKVVLKVFDLLGRKVATLVNKQQKAGSYEVNFDASNLPSGVYIYRIQTDTGFSDSKKMIYLK